MRRIIIAWMFVMTTGCVTGSPEGPDGCADISGTWDAEYINCRSTDHGTVLIQQRGCELSAVLPTQGRITGTIKGQSVDFKITYMFACEGSSEGTGQIDRSRVTGSFTGAAYGERCCEQANGSFTLTR